MNAFLQALLDYSPVGILKGAHEKGQRTAEAEQLALAKQRRDLNPKTLEQEFANAPGSLPTQTPEARVRQMFSAPEGPLPENQQNALDAVKAAAPATIASEPGMPESLRPYKNLSLNDLKEFSSARYFMPELGQTKTMTPEQALAAGTIAKGTKIIPPSAQTAETLSPESVKIEAEKYLANGSLPPMGFNKIARIQIMNEAARQANAMGETGQALMLRKAAYHASSAELTRMQTIRGPVESFANTASKNLDIVQSLSAQNSRTGVPLINDWLNQGKRAVAGDPAISQFDAALRTAANEYAKVTTAIGGGASGSVSDAARHEVDEMINAAQTPEQVAAVIQTLKNEMGNRTNALNAQIQQVRDQIISGQSTVGGGNSGEGSTPPLAKPIATKTPTEKDFVADMRNAVAAANKTPAKLAEIKKRMINAYPERADQINRSF